MAATMEESVYSLSFISTKQQKTLNIINIYLSIHVIVSGLTLQPQRAVLQGRVQL